MTNLSRQVFFRQLNDYFDKVYVVTIPRLKERHDHMVKLLDGLDFEFVNGVDREKLSAAQIEASYDQKAHLRLSRFKKALRSGEVACALSHIEVYKKGVAEGHEKVLVLEDDVALADDSFSELNASLNSLPKDWELVYLGYWKNESRPSLAWIKQGFYVLLSFLGLHKWSYKRHINTYPKKINEHVWKAGNHEGAYAYALTRSGMQKLLAENQPIKLNADHILSHLITNELLKGYITANKFFNPMIKKGKKYFGSETDQHS